MLKSLSKVKRTLFKAGVYDREFVAMIKKAANGNYITVDPKDVWGSLGLR